MNAKIAARYFDAEAWQGMTLRAMFEIRPEWSLREIIEVMTSVAVHYRLPDGSCSGGIKTLAWWADGLKFVTWEKLGEETVIRKTDAMQKLTNCAETQKEVETVLEIERRREERRAKRRELLARVGRGELSHEGWLAAKSALDAEDVFQAPKRRRKRS